MNEKTSAPLGRKPMSALILAISFLGAVLQPHLSVEGLIANLVVWSIFPLIVLWAGTNTSGRNTAVGVILVAIILFASIGSGLVPIGRQ